MGVTLLFITGARSEYGLAGGLLGRLEADPDVDLAVLPHGMHMQEEFGSTIREIREDGFRIAEEVVTASTASKVGEFNQTVERIHGCLLRHRPDAVFLVGDRLEAYGAALAAHFARIPVIHSGGGHWTTGAVDNIYRFNISNLAALHLVTSVGAWERLRRSPLVLPERVHHVGSVAVDRIASFQANPRPASDFIATLAPGGFALMTFHPVTAGDEPIPELVRTAIDTILGHGHQLVGTYPNNDEGSGQIIETLEANRRRLGFHLIESLGYEGYMAALAECSFVVGNSSSGLMEAPYFHKPVLDVGSRQEGREKDVGVRSVASDPSTLKAAIVEGFRRGWPEASCNMLYGDGNSVERAHAVIRNFLFASTGAATGGVKL